MEKHELTERKPFRTKTRKNTGVQSKRDREYRNVITGELLFVRKGHSSPCLSVT